MHRIAFLILALAALLARAEMPPRYATSERIVTIEQWGGRGQVATVWAVLPTKIIVYHVEGSKRDQLLRIVSVGKKEEEQFRQLVSSIRAESRGKVWLPRGVSDGVMMRISFTGDGSFRDDRIEVKNHWRTEFEELLAAISAQMPADLKITFREVLDRMPMPREIPVVSVSIKDYYRVP